MFRRGAKWRIGIKAKLYGAALLSALAVAILAVAPYHYARITDAAAASLYHDGFEGVNNSTRLQSLLEQHRRIVESAPAEVDRKRLEASQRAMIEISTQLSALLKRIANDAADRKGGAIEAQLAAQLPTLIERAQNVLFYASGFAQDKAIEASVEYARTADLFERLIRDYRARRQDLAHSAVQLLSKSARTLMLWVSLSALAALVLIGPIGLTITRGVLARIGRITRYMTELATHTMTEEVPSRGDHDEVGDMARAVQVFKDNAAELQERKCQLEEAKLHRDVALNNMTHGLCMFDAQQRLIICNGRFAAMYGLPEELTSAGTRLRDILDYRLAQGTLGERPREVIAEISRLEAAANSLKDMPDGRTISISRQYRADGGWVSVHEDVTERRRSEARITHLARHDQLTGLPNRAFFHEELESAVRHLHRGQRFAVHCLDLDRFKGVNDSLGHPVGDELLRQVGDRLRDCVEPCDFVGRLGGDEFAIIQTGVRRAEECSDLGSLIIGAISEPYSISGHQVIVSASIGIVLAPADGKSADELLKNADLAMYRAKADGRGAYCLFEPAMDDFIQMRRALELDLREALAANELQLYYQPQVDTRAGRVVGVEALLRWFHPVRGEIPPSEFIPLAEETGLICSLGEWVFRSACAEARKWPHDIRVAVNLSCAQVRSANITQVILGALAASGLPASRLEVEITESVLLEHDARTLDMLNQLRELGVRIAMDDFGTGYSSLSYLRSFPLDKIKIDQCFIRDLAAKGEARAIVRAITHLAAALNMGVVAEGVETADQLEILQSEGCFEVQGYYFNQPLPAAELGEAIGSRPLAVANVA